MEIEGRLKERVRDLETLTIDEEDRPRTSEYAQQRITSHLADHAYRLVIVPEDLRADVVIRRAHRGAVFSYAGVSATRLGEKPDYDRVFDFYRIAGDPVGGLAIQVRDAAWGYLHGS